MEQDNEAMNLPNKKRTLSRSITKPSRETNTSRFASTTKPEDFEKAVEGVIPNNTQQNMRWAVITFIHWVEE